MLPKWKCSCGRWVREQITKYCSKHYEKDTGPREAATDRAEIAGLERRAGYEKA